MLPSVLNVLDFAATGAAGAASPTAQTQFGTLNLIGAGCWLAPIVAALLLGGIR